MAKKKVAKKNKGGRPRAVIDEHQITALMRLSPTLEDTAAFFKVSTDTIELFIKRTWKKSFTAFREENAVETRLSLRRTAIQKAQKGDNTMIIWCMKNLCGWKDKQEFSGPRDQPLVPAETTQLIILPSNGYEVSRKELEERKK